MNFSLNASLLVLLIFLVSSIFYYSINIKNENIAENIKIKEFSVKKNYVINYIKNNLGEIVREAFLNASYKIMKERRFFNNTSEALSYIENYIKNRINNSISILNISNLSLYIKDVYIYPTDDPLIVGVSLNGFLSYYTRLNNSVIIGTEPIEIKEKIKLSYIPDPYVYLNTLYWNWTYKLEVKLNNLNDNENHTIYIILNPENFNYDHMDNKSSPNEIRVVGKDLVLLPYWIQRWEPDGISIIWVKVNKDLLDNGNTLYILYGSPAYISRENPKETFIFFDDFNNNKLNDSLWNISGSYNIKNSILKVYGTSSIYSKETYGNGYELLFKANFTSNPIQYIGFFNSLEDNGIGWYVNSSGLYIKNENISVGQDYLNNYYIYSIKRENNSINFTIFNDILNEEWNYITNYGVNNNYSISINTKNNGVVYIDWIALRDINNITYTIGEEYKTNYKEPIPLNKTFYYGDPSKYELVDDGRYSIIGLFTNATQTWGTRGYKFKLT